MSRCEVCGVFVKDENLWKHYKKVHPKNPLPTLEQKPIREPRRVKQPRQPLSPAVKVVGIAVLILAAAIGVGIYYAPSTPEGCISGHTGIAYHWHTELLVYEDGNLVMIPANVGIEPGCMKPIHTHAEDNKIHIEPSDADMRFTVGDFLEEWGRPFSNPQRMTVDGESVDPSSDIILLDGMVVEIYY